jgi:hypothetical protein
MNLSGVVMGLRGLYGGSAAHGRAGSSRCGGGGGGSCCCCTLGSKNIRIEQRIIVVEVSSIVCVMRPEFWLQMLHKCLKRAF